MRDVIAKYQFYFFLPRRKFKICLVIFKEGEKIGMISASEVGPSGGTCCLIQSTGQLGGPEGMRSFTRAVSQARGEECVTPSSGRKGLGPSC